MKYGPEIERLGLMICTFSTLAREKLVMLEGFLAYELRRKPFLRYRKNEALIFIRAE